MLIFSWQTQIVSEVNFFLVFSEKLSRNSSPSSIVSIWWHPRGSTFVENSSGRKFLTTFQLFHDSIKLVFIRQNQPQVATDVVYRSSNHLRLTVNFIREQTIWLKSPGAWIVGTRNYPLWHEITNQLDNFDVSRLYRPWVWGFFTLSPLWKSTWQVREFLMALKCIIILSPGLL